MQMNASRIAAAALALIVAALIALEGWMLKAGAKARRMSDLVSSGRKIRVDQPSSTSSSSSSQNTQMRCYGPLVWLASKGAYDAPSATATVVLDAKAGAQLAASASALDLFADDPGMLVVAGTIGIVKSVSSDATSGTVTVVLSTLPAGSDALPLMPVQVSTDLSALVASERLVLAFVFGLWTSPVPSSSPTPSPPSPPHPPSPGNDDVAIVKAYLAQRSSYGWVPRSAPSQPPPNPTYPAVETESANLDGPPLQLLPQLFHDPTVTASMLSDVTSLLTPASALPTCLGYVNPMPVRQQGDENSCVGHATSAMREYHARLYQNVYYYLSPQFLYDVAGPYPNVAMSCLVNYGVCPEQDCPADVAVSAGSCPQDNLAVQDTHAMSFVSAPVFFQIATVDEARVALYDIGPFVVAVSVYDADGGPRFWAPQYDGQPSSGAHMLCVESYSDVTQSFTVRNSWGANVGTLGYYDMPYVDFMQYGIMAYVMLPLLPPLLPSPAP